VGDVDAEHAAAARAGGADQHRLPVVVVGVAHGELSVDVVALALGTGAVVAVGQQAGQAQHAVGHVGEHLAAVGGVEGMQHAVVGADEHVLALVGGGLGLDVVRVGLAGGGGQPGRGVPTVVGPLGRDHRAG